MDAWANITREKLERWLCEPVADFAGRCEHAAKMMWRQARDDPERREENLRASRGMAALAQELREFDEGQRNVGGSERRQET